MTDSSLLARETDIVVRMTTVLLRHVLPLFRRKRNREPALVGSSFIVSSGQSSFLVSAAHVLDEWQSLFFYIEPSNARKLSGSLLRTKLPPSGNRQEDRMDVGVLKLEGPALPPYPKVDKLALPISDLRPRALPRGDKQYILVGFPGTRSTVNRPAREVKSEAVSFRNISAPASKYAEVGVGEDWHLVLNLDLERVVLADGSIGAFPKPSGLSGSPVWLLYDAIGENDRARTPVVGVVVEYYKESKALVATDIEAALRLISAVV